MKKLLLSIIFALITSVTAFAVDLNPFAYGLSSELSDDQTKLTVNYKLNSTATSVALLIYDGEELIKTVDCSTEGLSAGSYSIDVPTDDLHEGVKLTWKIEVNGRSVLAPAELTKNYALYHPSSLDVDNNPENETFGMLMVAEGMQVVKNKANYLSSGFGAGIFVFDAAFNPIPNGKNPGFNGGITFTEKRPGYESSTKEYATAYAPRRIRISDDGRIFVTSLNTNGTYLWELNPQGLDEWTPVFHGTMNNVGELEDANGVFIVGPNCGFDVKGSADDLTLLMYSVNKEGIDAAKMSGFKLAEYNLGTKKSWNVTPSNKLVTEKYAINYMGTQVEYDNEGGIWIASYRITADNTNPGLVHINKDGVEDYKKVWSNVCKAGIRFNNNFEKLLVAGNNTTGGSGETKKATLYTVSKDAEGKPKLTKDLIIDMSTIGTSLNDFAFDYAGNLYVCGNVNEKVAVWAMPYSGKVVTPASSKYAFELTPKVQGELNPFAYKMSSSYNAADMTLTVNFSINASATNVKIIVSDGEEDFVMKDYANVAKGDYSSTFDVSYLPKDVELTWRVDVQGKAVDVATFVDNSNKLFSPTSIDIDNNPKNANFGTVFCVEGKSGGFSNTQYLSSVDGAGLYVFNADGSARTIPNQSSKRYGYNGGGRVNQDPGLFYSYTQDDVTYNNSGYCPYRVRVSEDGRIFVTSLTPDGQVLWEVDKRVFSNPDDSQWSSYLTWTKVISSDNANTRMQTETTDAKLEFKDIFNLYTEQSGEFIAGPNMGFDVRGSGTGLKLLMLSGSKRAIAHTSQEQFRCDEYDLGEKTQWTEKASRVIFNGDILNYQGAQVQYDENGNVWMSQHRVAAGVTLKMYNRNGGDNYTEPFTAYRRCGAIRFNKDFTQVAIASAGSGKGGAVTIYPILFNGMPDWANGKEINTYAKTGYSIMDIAWDYANNLYLAADHATNGRCIAIYAMPHDETDVVSTPAKTTFTVDCQSGKTHRVVVQCNQEQGVLTCAQQEYSNIVSRNGMEIPACTELTVVAVPNTYCKFLNWKNQNGVVVSENAEYTFHANRDITLTANFESEDFNVTWHNLFVNDDDIFSPTLDVDKNARLWYLFMPYYNVDGTDPDRGIKGNLSTGELDVMTFCYTSTDELMQGGAMDWLGEYFRTKVNSLNIGDNCYAYSACMFAFVNRVGYAKNSQGTKLSGSYQGINTSELSVFANGAASPDEWRPWWAEHACGLKAKMAYGERMPITWTKADGPSKYDYDTYTSILPTSGILTKTPLWYQWNKVKTIPNGSDDTHILAWRDGSISGSIVEYVSRPDMKLYATYVKKNIDENNAPAKPANYDATNEDVVMLLTNPNFGVGASHKLSITRKLVAGMYNTICLPFDLVVEGPNGLEDSHPLKGATIMDFTGVTITNNQAGESVRILEFTQVYSMQAGKPYLIKLKEGSSDITNDLMFSNVVKECITLTPQVGETYDGITFNGVLNPTTINEKSIILVANDRLALTTEDGDMLGMRGYFTIDQSDPIYAKEIAEQAADGRVYLSFKKPVTTSIPVAPEAEQQLKPEVRKVMHNGQIYILRGDEVYTITGHRVK